MSNINNNCNIKYIFDKNELIKKLDSINNLIKNIDKQKCLTTKCKYKKEFYIGNKEIILHLLDKCY
jgi:hypothetical protein